MVDEADAPDPHLPSEEMADESTRWGYVILALLAAVVGAVFAPEGWAPGAGRVTCRWKGEVVAEAPVQVGGAEAVTLEGATNGVRLFVALPAGVPVDKPVRATVRAERGGEPFRPRLDDVRLTLVLSEGSEELVPILKWDGKAQHLDAARRPPVDTAVVLAILGIVIVLWVTEAIPLWVTALIVPIVIVASGMGKAKPALAPFFHPIIALFFGGFMLAQAMHRVGLDRRIATTIVSRAGRSPAMLFAAMLAVSAFLSMWMSNTASTAVLIPIAIAITAPLRHEGYRKAMVLGIAYAATIGGVGSLIGTPANPLAVEFLDTFVGRTITFTEWFAFGLPLVVLFLPVMGIYLWRRSKVNVQKETFAEARAVARREHEEAGPATRDQKIVLAVFVGTMLLWLSQRAHGLHPGIVALICVATLALLGMVKTADLGRISWSALITFGGGLALGVFLVESGTSDWVATRFVGLAGLPHIVTLSAVALLALGLTAVASNTATAAMLVPLSIPLAGVLGMDPVMLVIIVSIASSIDFALVIGTPPTMIAYSTGLYKTREIFKMGIVLDLIGIAILVSAVVWLWQVMGLV